MRSIKRQCTASWESVGTERGSLQGPHLADRRIVLKRTFVSRRGSRGNKAIERERERRRTSTLVARKYFSFHASESIRLGRSSITDLGSRITSHESRRGTSRPSIVSAATTTRGSDRLLLGDRDDLNFRLIYHGVRGSSNEELSLREGKSSRSYLASFTLRCGVFSPYLSAAFIRK